MKLCSGCGETKTADAFHRRRKSLDGLAARCKECTRAYGIARRLLKGDELRAKKRESIARNPEANRARVRAWRRANPEKRQALEAKYRERHLLEVRAKNQAWQAASRYGVENAPRVDLAALFVEHGGRCHICGFAITGDWEADHVIPLSRGGEHTAANMRPSHAHCNRLKRNRLMDEMSEDRLERCRATSRALAAA